MKQETKSINIDTLDTNISTIDLRALHIDEIGIQPFKEVHWANTPKIYIVSQDIAMRDRLEKKFAQGDYIHEVHSVDGLKEVNLYLALNIDFLNAEEWFKFGTYCGLVSANKSYMIMRSVLFTYNVTDFNKSCSEVHLMKPVWQDVEKEAEEVMIKFLYDWNDMYGDMK